MTTQEAVDVVVRVLGPHIGDTMARSAAEAHCRKLGIAGAGAIRGEELEGLLGKLAGGLNIFLGRERSAAVIGDVRSALAAREGSA